MQYEWTEWDEDVKSTPDEEYQSLVRSLKRKNGFGLFFVRCTPVGGQELIKKIDVDVPQKQFAVLELNEPISNLIDLVKVFPDIDNLKILFIVGLEKSLVEYIRTGYGGQGDYYNLDTVPPILSHLNWQRENFRDKFRHLSFVFLLPRFAIKYIIRRAPDFFDWGSGTVEFPSDRESVEQDSSRILLEGEYEEYLTWTPQQITNRLIEINELIAELHQSSDQKAFLLFEQGNIFLSSKQYEEAIASYDRALQFKPDLYEAWNNRGNALGNLDRHEEAIASYDRVVQIKLDYHTWYDRGIALNDLEKYEESIASYSRVLEIKLDYDEAWHNRGFALRRLGRYEKVIATCDRALEIEPSILHEIWYNRGFALRKLGRYGEAITSYDRALEIKPDYHQAWYGRGVALGNLGRDEEAIASWDKILTIDKDNYYVWYDRAKLLYILGSPKKAIVSIGRGVLSILRIYSIKLVNEPTKFLDLFVFDTKEIIIEISSFFRRNT